MTDTFTLPETWASLLALLKSKTFWANVVMGALVYLNQVPAVAQPFVPYVIAGVNILLRFLTS